MRASIVLPMYQAVYVARSACYKYDGAHRLMFGRRASGRYNRFAITQNYDANLEPEKGPARHYIIGGHAWLHNVFQHKVTTIDIIVVSVCVCACIVRVRACVCNV